MKAVILFCFSYKSASVLKLLGHTKIGFISSPYPDPFPSPTLLLQGQDVPLSNL